MSLCEITPVSAFMSTNLNSQIECYQRLGQRILRTLGHPMINVQIHPDQLYEAISMSIDFFTKYAGYTKEVLIFDSRIYDRDRGLRLDQLYTVASNNFSVSEQLQNRKLGPNPDYKVDIPDSLFIAQSAIPYSFFSNSSELSSSVPEEGIEKMQLINKETYEKFLEFDPSLEQYFIQSKQKNFNISCEKEDDVKGFNNMFDYDILDYRKVIDVTRFEEGSSTGVNNLFSLETLMAQQSYFASFGLGNFGFDMLSWHGVKNWIDNREKMFSTRREISFDSRTQIMRLIPQPKGNTRFYGTIECYVERPLRDLVKEKWVLEYATALSKIMWGRILTHITGVQLLGGGSFNGDSVLSEGLSEKDKLEEMLIEGGYGDVDPVLFLVS
jgi:hypothetical protein